MHNHCSDTTFQPHVEYSFKVDFTSTNCSHIHTHEHIQFVYIYSGRMTYHLNGINYPLESGDLMIVNPNQEHGFHSVEPDETATCFLMGCSGFQFCGKEANHMMLPEGSPIVHCNSILRTELVRITNKMLFECGNCMLGKTYMLQAYAIQFLTLLSRDISSSIVEPSEYTSETYSKSGIVKEIIHYMYSHYMEKITLESLAKIMYLSPVYISKIFKDETGDSPINYLIKIRLSKAKELLTPDNEDSIKVIASQVGYDDVYHFSKLFKKYYGISPLYYKKTEKAN